MKKILLALTVVALTAMSCKNTTEEKKDTMENQTADEMAYDNSDNEMMTDEDTMSEEETVVGVAVGNEDFSTLETAITSAGLAETLEEEGPYTVFAPTNDAFDKQPDGVVDSWLKPENKSKLANVLTYHVVSGDYKAQDIVNAINENDGSFEIATLNGGKLTATLNGENVILTDEKGQTATVVQTDVKASNGTIHAIDAVVMPSIT